MLPQPGLKVVRYASPGCITGASPGYEPGLVELCVLVQCDMDMRHKGWLDLWHGFRHKKCNPEWLRHRLFSLSCTACDVLCSLHTGGMVIAWSPPLNLCMAWTSAMYYFTYLRHGPSPLHCTGDLIISQVLKEKWSRSTRVILHKRKEHAWMLNISGASCWATAAWVVRLGKSFCHLHAST